MRVPTCDYVEDVGYPTPLFSFVFPGDRITKARLASSKTFCLLSPQYWVQVHKATPGFSCVSVNQIQGIMLDPQADALTPFLVYVYLREYVSYMCGCWQRSTECTGFPRAGVTSCLTWTLRSSE